MTHVMRFSIVERDPVIAWMAESVGRLLDVTHGCICDACLAWADRDYSDRDAFWAVPLVGHTTRPWWAVTPSVPGEMRADTRQAWWELYEALADAMDREVGL